MNKNIINIVTILLMVIIPTSVFGVEIHHHFCDSTKVHLVSLFQDNVCATELKNKEAATCAEVSRKLNSCCENETGEVASSEEPKSCCSEHSEEAESVESNDGSTICDNINLSGAVLTQKTCCSNFTERFALDDEFEFAIPTININLHLSPSLIESAFKDLSSRLALAYAKSQSIPKLEHSRNRSEQLRFIGIFNINKSGDDDLIS